MPVAKFSYADAENECTVLDSSSNILLFFFRCSVDNGHKTLHDWNQYTFNATEENMLTPSLNEFRCTEQRKWSVPFHGISESIKRESHIQQNDLMISFSVEGRLWHYLCFTRLQYVPLMLMREKKTWRFISERNFWHSNTGVNHYLVIN